jgi:hypothetical protein
MTGGRGCASTGEGKKGKGRAERGCGRLAWRPCHGCGWSLPLSGVARTRACALRWCGGVVKRLRLGGRKKRGRERHAGSTGQRDMERWFSAGLTWAAVWEKMGRPGLLGRLG